MHPMSNVISYCLLPSCIPACILPVRLTVSPAAASFVLFSPADHHLMLLILFLFPVVSFQCSPCIFRVLRSSFLSFSYSCWCCGCLGRWPFLPCLAAFGIIASFPAWCRHALCLVCSLLPLSCSRSPISNICSPFLMALLSGQDPTR